MDEKLREGPLGREELMDGWTDGQMDNEISGGKNVCSGSEF